MALGGMSLRFPHGMAAADTASRDWSPFSEVSVMRPALFIRGRCDMSKGIFSRGSNVASVRGTNDDAAVSKLSAIKLGYYQDPHLEYFVQPQAVTRRAPIINRGYYSRVAAISALIDEFLSGGDAGQRKQIVSFGAGFDTMYFRLKVQDRQPWKYFEIDYPETVHKKCRIIKSRKELLAVVNRGQEACEEAGCAEGGAEGIAEGGGAAASKRREAPGLSSDEYMLVGADLQDVGYLENQLLGAGLDLAAPTLFLSECVLVYMAPEDSARLIQWAGTRFTGGSALVSYEQILPFDAFGRTMVRNLNARGCSLLGLERYPDLAAQRQRYLGLGWRHWGGVDMKEVYEGVLDAEDRRRVEKLELFDEVEEWHMIQRHYCICVATNDAVGAEDSSWLASFGLVGRGPGDPTP